MCKMHGGTPRCVRIKKAAPSSSSSQQNRGQEGRENRNTSREQGGVKNMAGREECTSFLPNNNKQNNKWNAGSGTQTTHAPGRHGRTKLALGGRTEQNEQGIVIEW